MYDPPYLAHHFPSRPPARSRLNFPWYLADWLSRTGFRFNATVLALILAAVVMGDSRLAVADKLMGLAFVPLAAVLIVPMWRLSLMLSGFLPVVGVVAGFARLIWYRTFSRFIVEPAPVVHQPLWQVRHR